MSLSTWIFIDHLLHIHKSFNYLYSYIHSIRRDIYGPIFFCPKKIADKDDLLRSYDPCDMHLNVAERISGTKNA
jgi:hypothetical protein